MGRRPRDVTVAVDIAAPIDRVWDALCDPIAVEAWDGAVPLDVPAGYPQPGHGARWRIRLLGVPATLHDEVREVDAPAKLRAELRTVFVVIDETYELHAVAPDRTRVVSHNRVRSRVAGFDALAARAVHASVTGAMRRLRSFCEDAADRT